MNNYKHVCMLLLGWLTCIVLFSACKKDVYDPNKNEPAKDISPPPSISLWTLIMA